MSEPAAAPVRVETARGVATVTLADVGTRNALTPELVDGLADALDAAERSSAVRVVVLTNDGPAFCSGADLRGSSTATPRRSVPQLLERLLTMGTPVVGRIAGHCTGGGVGLAAACDISIAADDVHLGFTEVRLGVVPAIISVVCLPKLRPADAAELFLTGRRIPAARAAEVGLLNRAVPRADLDAAVAEVCDEVARGGPEALAIAKSLIRTVPAMPRDEAFAWAERTTRARFASIEAAEGVAAFREGRDAAWVPPPA
jgi:methylglutaconyl-CoA hydratase